MIPADDISATPDEIEKLKVVAAASRDAILKMTPKGKTTTKAASNGKPNDDLKGVPAQFREPFQKLEFLERRLDKNGWPYWFAKCPAGCGHPKFCMTFSVSGEPIAACGKSCDIRHFATLLNAPVFQMKAEDYRAATGRELAAPTPVKFEWIDSDQFANGDYRHRWLIEMALVADQPAIVAAPVKSLKTSIAVDACISMATGTAFLGRFKVPSVVKTAIASMESGQASLQSTARRICAARNIALADAGKNLIWTFSVPVLSDRSAVAEFVTSLVARGIKAVLLDPLYLCLGDVDAKNMMEVGMVLRSVADMMIPEGITPIIVHHANRQVERGKPMGLEHIAYSGCDAFARQMILMNRREEYQHDGEHKLWLSIGGSAFNGPGIYALDVSEGVSDANFGGRRWDVAVLSAADLEQEAASGKEAKIATKERKKMADEEASIFECIDSETSKGQPAATITSIKKFTGWQSKRVNDTIKRMLEESFIQFHEWDKETGNKATMTVGGYRRPVKIEQREMQFSERGVNDDLPTVLPSVPTVQPVQVVDGRGNGRESSPCIGGISLPSLPSMTPDSSEPIEEEKTKPMRVFELAKELDIEPKELLERCWKYGMNVTNSLKKLTDEQVRTLRSHPKYL